MAWAAVAATAVSALGTMQSAKAQSASDEGQAAVLGQQATSTRQQSTIDAEDFLRAQRRTLATSRAARSASGVQPFAAGSALAVDEDLVREIAYQTAKIRRGGEIEAHRLDQQASLFRSGASGARKAGGIGGLTTILGGASTTFGGS